MISSCTKSLPSKISKLLTVNNYYLESAYKTRNDGKIINEGRYLNKRDSNPIKKLFKT